MIPLPPRPPARALYRYFQRSVGTVGPKEAQELLSLPRFDGQTYLDEEKVDHLMAQMRNGLFDAATLTLATCTVGQDDRTYLIDGQHVCTAVVFGRSALVGVGRLHYLVDTDDQMRSLYARMHAYPVSTDQFSTTIERLPLDEVVFWEQFGEAMGK